jgi:predicted metal-dependent hydrolase
MASGNIVLNYLLVRSKKRKKTISLQLKKDGSIVIHAPRRVSEREIDLFFHSKKDWLQKKIMESQGKRAESDTKKFTSGEIFYYLGSPYPLIVVDGKKSGEGLTFSGHQFILSGIHAHQAEALFVTWYKEKAREYIEERVRHYSGILKLYPERVRIGSARSRWGSCSHKNHLSFTWRLIMAPHTVVDYVVIHELAHIKEKNHSNRFWNLVEEIVSDYGTHRKWLRQKGHLLNI